MVQACSMVGGATIPPCTDAAAASGSVYTGLASPTASHQCRIMAWLPASWAVTGAPADWPAKARSFSNRAPWLVSTALIERVLHWPDGSPSAPLDADRLLGA